jgi:23S rRNA (uracil1939-C5)-methyltransferase
VGEQVLAGFREGFGSRVARMSDCKTLALPFARMLPELRHTLGRLSQPGRIPQVELAGGDRDFAIIVRHLTELDRRDRDLLADFGRRTGMRLFVQPGGYDTVTPLRQALDPDSGTQRGDDPHLSYTNADFGLCYQFLPTDFTQVNPYVNRALVRDALLGLAPRPGGVVVDLFCGIGNFSLAMARLGMRVLGLENAAGAVARATGNAANNGLSAWAEFALADLYDARCPELPEADYLVLDPPRSGAGPNLERWVDSPRLQRIAYVSCNPRSFAGDAARLADQGFELDEAGIFDMFPHTAHVETLGLFSRHGLARHRG